ncbi:MAG TPA: 2-hydroxyglutaryl-CoA dehydratase [Peptococcaceae bacterium]|nr:MAG: CoA-substrate-specific enzyme activase [Clostridia bacterium 41_269]HBT19982.1 2-hydroxyglutaryl-CoA dehydratase [Peptococcaceae bacterium]
MKTYLGIDVGSVSTDLVLIDENNNVLSKVYIRTSGQPIKAVQKGLKLLAESVDLDCIEVAGVGTTGSARYLSAVIVGADVIKNEITAHAVAASALVPDVKTIIEIGGQDSKLIILRNGIVVDFAMNTICAAGTGSFLDQQAARLNIPIEEFGSYALRSKNPVRIAGRCSVFAETDMIHKQQMGHKIEDLIAGLCNALVRNYLNNVGKGKEILPPVVFQGGVAANIGIKKAFEEELGMEIIVPEHHAIMGAIGAAIIAKNECRTGKTNFKGFSVSDLSFSVSSFECKDCPNLCEVINIVMENVLLCRWGGRCGKWENMEHEMQKVQKL